MSRISNPSVGASPKENNAFASFWLMLDDQLNAIDGSKPATFKEAVELWHAELPAVDCALILIATRGDLDKVAQDEIQGSAWYNRQDNLSEMLTAGRD